MKIIEVIFEQAFLERVEKIAQKLDLYYRLGPQEEDERRSIRIIVSPEKRQELLDLLQSALVKSESARIIVIPAEVVLPRSEEDEEKTEKQSVTTTREELYYGVEKGARLDSTYLLLVFLSTVVAAIGLLEDNVAVVIGAMVIAPLLGPNIALALASALGDSELAVKGLKTGLSGLGLAFVISVVIGLIWPLDFNSQELISRTHVGLDSLALALASGAAAVLSLTTGLSSVLVGVMVAVALLPPTATMGMLLGNGQVSMALGAGLLLAANIVCVNLAAKVVFLIKGVKPRTWLEKKKAKQSMAVYLLLWIISLAIIVIIILFRQ